jgi:hypothetical protein
VNNAIDKKTISAVTGEEGGRLLEPGRSCRYRLSNDFRIAL